MYEPYPASEPAQEPTRIERPRSVLRAVRVMYAGAVLEVLALVVALLTRSRLRFAILTRHPAYSAAHLHSAEVVRTFPRALGAVIAIGLWLWMAWANGKGHNWARVLSAVLFGINTLSLLASFFLVRGAAALIIGLVIWLVGLAAIVLIFSRDSGPFYNQQPAL